MTDDTRGGNAPAPIPQPRLPVFTIETPSGHRLDIEAPDQETALAGARQWHEAQQPSGFITNAQQGTADFVGGVGKTIQAHLGDGYGGQTLQDAAKSIAPANFVPAPIYDKEGFHASGILPSLARVAPIAAGTVLGGLVAASLAPEALATAAGVAGAAGIGTLADAGNEAQTVADKRTDTPNSPITHSDLVKGDAISGVKNLVGGLVVPRYLSKLAGGTAAETGTGLTGAASALKKLQNTAALQAAASGTQDAIGQAGQSLGTPGGVNIDPTQVVNSALTGAAAGGLFGAKGAVRDTLNAAKYSAITPELQPAAQDYAALIKQHADGDNLNAGYFLNGKAQRTGEEATNKARTEVQGNLKDAVDQLQAPLPRPAQNVIDAVLNGQRPSPRDYGVLQNAVQGDPQASAVMGAARMAHVANIVQDTGRHADGKFSGGIGDFARHVLTGENVGKTGLVAGSAALAAENAGHLIAYSPEMLSAAAGGTVLAKLADHLTGAAAPAGRFVQNFPGGTAPAAPVVIPQQQPQPAAQFSGHPVAGGTMLTPQIQAAMAARANLQKLAQANQPVAPVGNPNMGPATRPPGYPTPFQTQTFTQQAMPLLRELAQRAKPVTLPTNFASTLSSPSAAPVAPPAALANAAGASVAARQAAPTAPTPQITGVSKANGKIGTEHTADEYVVPSSAYGHMLPGPAAKAITDDAMKGPNPPFNRAKFEARVLDNLNAIWDRARALQSEAPGIDPKAIYSQFAGVKSQTDAIAHRNWLQKQMPQHAAALGKFFTDADIKGTHLVRGMWSR